MKFIVSSQLLLKNLNTIGGVVSSSNTLPILDNFLFDIGENKLTVTGSDLETTMTTSFEVTSKEKGQVAIPSRILIDLLKSFPDTPITFSINEETHAVRFTSEYGEYNVAGLNAEEFPKVPELESTATVVVGSDLLARAIEKTIFAAGNDELRPVMSGVFFELHEGKIMFVSTDAHKLV